MTRAGRLRRFRELRRLEEQDHATVLESARAELQQIDDALQQTSVRKMSARSLIEKSMGTGKTRDWIAGHAEIDSAERVRTILKKRKHLAEQRVESAQARYLAKRIESRQAETLLRAALHREEKAAQRRNQSALDEWFRGVCCTRATESDNGASAEPPSR